MKDQIAIQTKGLAGTTATAASASVTWIEQANQVVDLVAGVVAVVAGLCTIAWYVYQYQKSKRED